MKSNIFINTLLGLVMIFVLTIIFPACGDMFDQEPQGAWTQDDLKAGSFESTVYELYGLIKNYNPTSGLPPLAIHNWRSEDVEKGSEIGDNAQHAAMFDDFDYSASNGLLSAYWGGNFDVINRANDLIDTLVQYDKAGHELTLADSVNLGEAMFFRAYCYFNLVRAFGEVPLVDFKIHDAFDANIPKSPVSDIYALIDSDLKLASRTLPLMWDKAFTGRLTKGAADALHARTYMMRSDWGNMYGKAMSVMNLGLYDLSTPYPSIFRETGENSRESVFELQCMSTTDRKADSKIGSQYAQVQGVRGSGDWNLGWGFNCPTQELADAFEAGDPRKDETLLYFYKAGEDESQAKPNEPWGEKPRANAGVMNKFYNKKVYTNPAIRTEIGHLQGFWFNIRIIRYADVVLMAAEATNELGNVSEASMLLEQVRERARGGNDNILPKRETGDQDLMRDYIKHERRVELGCEWDRFYDLVRWGDARRVLHAAGKTNYQEKHNLLPLPQSVIDQSNGVLVQNPNY